MTAMATPNDSSAIRARHSTVLGRKDVLAKLHRLTSTNSNGWVLVRGGPGVGKSALLSAFISELEHDTAPVAGGTTQISIPSVDRLLVSYHFIYRGHQDSDRPEVITSSLVDQVEIFLNPSTHTELHENTGLWDTLLKVSTRILVPQQKRLVLVVDGLDEIETNHQNNNPIQQCLPALLPPGVFVVCSSRPFYPHLTWLESRDNMTVIDLDDEQWKQSNETASRAFWQERRASFSPHLSEDFIRLAVNYGKGNLLYAVKLCEWLHDQPPNSRQPDLLPKGMSNVITQMWERLRTSDGHIPEKIVEGLGILVATRESISLSHLGSVLGWNGFQWRDDFLKYARPFLLEEPSCLTEHSTEPVYRPYHDTLRAFIIQQIGDNGLKACHEKIVNTLARWPVPAEADKFQHHYAAQHAMWHRANAADHVGLHTICHDLTYLEALCQDSGPSAVEIMLRNAAQVLSSDPSSHDVRALEHAVRMDSHWLQKDASMIGPLLHNRLRSQGWSHKRIAQAITPSPIGLLLRNSLNRSNQELRTLAKNSSEIVKVMIDSSGTLGLVATADGMVRSWNIQTGEDCVVLYQDNFVLTDFAASSDGRVILLRSDHDTLTALSLRNDSYVRICPGIHYTGAEITLNASGTQAAWVELDGSLMLWKIGQSVLPRKIGTAGHRCSAITMSDDGACVVTSTDLGNLIVWNMIDASMHVLFDDIWSPLVAISGDGTHLLAKIGVDHKIVLWHIGANCEPNVLIENGSCVEAFALNSDGTRAAIGLPDGDLLVWDAVQVPKLRIIGSHGNQITSLSMTQDGSRIISASEDRICKTWDLSKLSDRNPLHARDPVRSVKVSSDGNKSLVVHSERNSHRLKLMLFDLQLDDQVCIVEYPNDSIKSCAADTNISCVVSVSTGGAVKLWRNSDGEWTPEPLSTINHWEWAGIAMSGNGNRIAWLSRDGIRAQDVNGNQFATPANYLISHSIAISGDGNWVVTTRDHYNLSEVIAWDVASDSSTIYRICALPSLEDKQKSIHSPDTLSIENEDFQRVPNISAIAISTKGQRVMCGDMAGNIAFLDLRNGSITRVMNGHEDVISTVAMRADGELSVSASLDHTLKVWNVKDGTCISTAYGHAPFLAVDIVGKTIVAGDELGNTWVLDLVQTSADSASSPELSKNEHKQTDHPLMDRHSNKYPSVKTYVLDNRDEQTIAEVLKFIKQNHSIKPDWQSRLRTVFDLSRQSLSSREMIYYRLVQIVWLIVQLRAEEPVVLDKIRVVFSKYKKGLIDPIWWLLIENEPEYRDALKGGREGIVKREQNKLNSRHDVAASPHPSKLVIDNHGQPIAAESSPEKLERLAVPSWGAIRQGYRNATKKLEKPFK